MSLFIDLVKQAKGKPTDKVTQSTYDKRTAICSLCPKKMITGNCLVCGCFVSDKARYMGESCPLKKW